jgi:hypothetical protein
MDYTLEIIEQVSIYYSYLEPLWKKVSQIIEEHKVK